MNPDILLIMIGAKYADDFFFAALNEADYITSKSDLGFESGADL